MPQPINVSPSDTVIGDSTSDVSRKTYLEANFNGIIPTGTSWRLQLAKDQLSQPVIYSGTTDDIFRINVSLAANEVYGWSVQYWIGNTANVSPWSDVTFFRTNSGELATPFNVTPEDKAIDVSLLPTLVADFGGEQPDATRWVIQGYDDLHHAKWMKVYNNVGSSNILNIPSSDKLPPDLNYNWNVTFTKNAINSDSSRLTTFRTKKLKPIVKTLQPTNITIVGAEFNGEIVSTDEATLTKKGFIYGLAPDENVCESIYETKNLVIGSYKLEPNYLLPGKKYYVRAFVTDGTFEGVGDWVGFTTPSQNTLTLPKVTTLPPTDITTKSVVPHGNIADTGGVDVTIRGFQWSKATDGSMPVGSSSDSGKFTVGDYTKIPVIPLASPNTIYYIRAYATNLVGTSYGDFLQFKSKALAAPQVTTTAPAITDLTATTVTPRGSITDTGGSPVTVRGFRWSIAKDAAGVPVVYGKTYDTGTFDIGAYTKSPVINLKTPNTTFSIQAYATNAIGTTYGNWVDFKTLSN